MTEHIFDTVRRWEASRPDAAAIRFGATTLTWSQFAGRARRLAGALATAGIGAGDRVAVVDRNHLACLETTFACSLLGATNVVVNHRLTSEEMAYVLADSQARLVLAGEDLRPAVDTAPTTSAHIDRILTLGGADDEYEDFLASGLPVTSEPASAPETCFLQLYTSGTTGHPKGALLTHRSLLAHDRAAIKGFGFSEDSVNMVAMPLFHVGGTSWALAGIAAGCQTILVRDVDPPTILDQLQDGDVTHAFFVPAVFGFFLATDRTLDSRHSKLRCLAYGGSPMPPPLLTQVQAAFRVPLYQVYGMTEASGVTAILYPHDHTDSAHPERRTGAGRLAAGLEARVVDPATGADLPSGGQGEIWLRGEQVVAGYWHKPAETEAAIVDGWLRSGDIGWQDTDGYLYVTDRLKDMIISGGENVYPAEVERVLTEHPDIAEVAVIGVPDPTWGETVKAVVVPRKGVAMDPEAVIRYARQHLAGYKCPRSVELRGSLPRNATGKVLKRVLRSTTQPAAVDA